jgi:alpha/beta superfamily hydrolase
MKKEKMVTFDSDGLTLEGILGRPEDGNEGGLGVVVCHPHPLYGGTMDNMVVWGICDCLKKVDATYLRFNFRGVGESQGTHDDGKGEVQDVLSALGFLKGQDGIARVRLAGYSFGAMMAYNASHLSEDVDRVGCVALPVDYYTDLDFGPEHDVKVLLVGGSEDDVAPEGSLRRFLKSLGERGALEVLEGCDHFFGGNTKKVGETVATFLTK